MLTMLDAGRVTTYLQTIAELFALEEPTLHGFQPQLQVSRVAAARPGPIARAGHDLNVDVEVWWPWHQLKRTTGAWWLQKPSSQQAGAFARSMFKTLESEPWVLKAEWIKGAYTGPMVIQRMADGSTPSWPDAGYSLEFKWYSMPPTGQPWPSKWQDGILILLPVNSARLEQAIR